MALDPLETAEGVLVLLRIVASNGTACHLRHYWGGLLNKSGLFKASGAAGAD